jgi:indole-3-glycerol phosphate synthase
MVTTAPSILNQIVAHLRRRMPREQRREPLSLLQQMGADRPHPLDFAAALSRPGIAIIAEVKKASPSAGVLRPYLRPVGLARTYAAAGAAAISVLTEEKHFRGRLRYLSDIGAALDSAATAARPPLLRKDFIFDPYQVHQARAYGADALLLIVAMLDPQQLRELLQLTRSLGMEALVEVHDAAEAAAALDSGARVIGVNNRDLHTFRVDIETTKRVRDIIPADRVVVSESGIRGRDDMQRLREWGVNAALIGESLVTATSPGAKLRELLS